MYPLIVLGDIRIYTFGIFLIISWIVFFACLHYFSLRKGITKNIFSDIIPFTLAIFFFGRLVYMFSQWRSEKFIIQEFLTWEKWVREFLYAFFVSNNYNISLAGWVFGFFLIFLWKTHKSSIPKISYLDIILPAFLIASIIAYIGSYFGWQVYGIPYSWLWAIEYNTKFSTLPPNSPRFPLPFLYTFASTCLVWVYFLLSKRSLPNGFIWSALMCLFAVVLFFWEFLSGKPDIFEVYMRLNQLIAIIICIIGIIWILRNMWQA